MDVMPWCTLSGACGPVHLAGSAKLIESVFGIETSYRQMNQARIRTCTRNPLLRLFSVGIALTLRNTRVWFHLAILSGRFGRHLSLHLEELRFRTLLLYLQRVAEATLGCEEVLLALKLEAETTCTSTQIESETWSY